MAKAAVLQFWLAKLRTQAAILPSLAHLKTDFMGLTTCHPLFRSCGSSPWEVEKATTQARLLSGRFRLEALTSHWVPWNKEGLCTLPGCWGTPASHRGTVISFLMSCPSLTSTRLSLEVYMRNFLQANPHLTQLVSECLQSDPAQFWIDCSTMAPIVRATQVEGESVLFGLFKLTRQYCHTLYSKRCELLK